MKLQIQLFGRLGGNLGSEIVLEFAEISDTPTIRDVIRILIQKDPSLEPLLLRNEDLNPGTILLVNGHVLDRSKAGLDTQLKPQDTIIVDRLGFLEIVGGGAREIF
jgi:molybdopterin converting factor small subunit